MGKFDNYWYVKLKFYYFYHKKKKKKKKNSQQFYNILKLGSYFANESSSCLTKA